MTAIEELNQAGLARDESVTYTYNPEMFLPWRATAAFIPTETPDGSAALRAEGDTQEAAAARALAYVSAA